VCSSGIYKRPTSLKKSKGMLQIEVQDYYLIGPKENPRKIL